MTQQAPILSSPDARWLLAQRWAYAVGAPYHVQNGVSVDGLPLITGDLRRHTGAKLKDYWSLESADDLVKTLNWLGSEGHRRPYRERIRHYCMIRRPAVAARREELRPEQFEAEEERDNARSELWRIDAVQANWRGLRGANLLGFDATRAAMLVRDGLVLQWLPEHWAWRYLTDMAADVRGSFASWAEFAADFKLSRAMWLGSAGVDQFETIADRLITERESPWVRLPWAIDGLEVPRPVSPLEDGAPVWSLER